VCVSVSVLELGLESVQITLTGCLPDLYVTHLCGAIMMNEVLLFSGVFD
jgi:hypothetical protein